jgi:hypothetical protein
MLPLVDFGTSRWRLAIERTTILRAAESRRDEGNWPIAPSSRSGAFPLPAKADAAADMLRLRCVVEPRCGAAAQVDHVCCRLFRLTVPWWFDRDSVFHMRFSTCAGIRAGALSNERPRRDH